MNGLVAIGWFVGLLVAVCGVHQFFYSYGLVSMFPEGHRWWMPWGRLGSLAVFAAAVLANPFNGWLA